MDFGGVCFHHREPHLLRDSIKNLSCSGLEGNGFGSANFEAKFIVWLYKCTLLMFSLDGSGRDCTLKRARHDTFKALRREQTPNFFRHKIPLYCMSHPQPIGIRCPRMYHMVRNADLCQARAKMEESGRNNRTYYT
jgi:hypothetical protein